MTRILAWGVALAAVTACAPTPPAGPLQPLMIGWEQHFTVESQVTPRPDGSVVWGYLGTNSPYTFRQIQILIDAMDSSDQLVAQRLAWVIGTLSWPSRLFFQVPMPAAAAYRVQVFSYDRVETERRRFP